MLTIRVLSEPVPGLCQPESGCLWNPESSKYLLYNPESWDFESRTQLKESRIQNPLTIEIQNTSPTEKNPESMAGNPESRTVFCYEMKHLETIE